MIYLPNKYEYFRPGKGMRNNCNSLLLQLLRTLCSISRGILIVVCVNARCRHYW